MRKRNGLPGHIQVVQVPMDMHKSRQKRAWVEWVATLGFNPMDLTLGSRIILDTRRRTVSARLISRPSRRGPDGEVMKVFVERPVLLPVPAPPLSPQKRAAWDRWAAGGA